RKYKRRNAKRFVPWGGIRKPEERGCPLAGALRGRPAGRARQREDRKANPSLSAITIYPVPRFVQVLRFSGSSVLQRRERLVDRRFGAGDRFLLAEPENVPEVSP